MNKVVTGSLWATSLMVAGTLAGCGSGSSSGDSTTVTVAGDVPIAYAQRANTMRINPTNGGPSAPGGDLMIRDKSSASALEHNVTAQFTQGRGDVQNPEVSYDGKKIVFAMNCPADNTSKIGAVPACTGAWNIWEYDMTVGGLTGGTFRRLTATGNADVEPTYLPAGRGYVFTSNRQTKSSVNQALGRSYKARDEYERETVFNLHTMDADGGNVTQISFNQSHDRSPTVRQNGDIMFSRWDHVGGRNHFKVFRAKPDGTDLFVLYGAHSEGNSFLHPRDMDPKGKYAGFLTSDLMPLSGTHEGGGLMLIDAANFSEQNTPATPGVTGVGQQPGDGAGARHRPRPVAIRPHQHAVSALGRHRPRPRLVHALRSEPGRRRRLVRDADRRREGRASAWRPPGRGRPEGRAAGQRAPVVRDLHVRPEGADLPDRGGAAARLHEHAPGRDPAAHRAERDPADQRRRDACGAEPRPARSAQRLRHRRPRPHGQRRPDRGRRAGGLHDRRSP